MKVFRLAAAASLALLSLTAVSGTASADHDWGLRLIPRIYLPELPGWRGDAYNDEDYRYLPRKFRRDGFVYDPELDEWVPSKRVLKRAKRQMVYDPVLDEWVPVRETPREVVKKKRQADAAKKKQSRNAQVARAKEEARINAARAVAAKQKPKNDSVAVASAEIKAAPVVRTPQTAAVVKPQVKPETKQAVAAATSSAKPSGQTIGCTNGADIVAGYGFSSVKPKSCTGGTYTFDAKRAEKNYVISLSSASGEITDVKKVN